MEYLTKPFFWIILVAAVATVRWLYLDWQNGPAVQILKIDRNYIILPNGDKWRTYYDCTVRGGGDYIQDDKTGCTLYTAEKGWIVKEARPLAVSFLAKRYEDSENLARYHANKQKEEKRQIKIAQLRAQDEYRKNLKPS